MNILKLSSLTLLSTLVLASCGASKTAMTPIASIETIALKNGKINESELKRWSHLDILKDTIPGMSVDKAYAELIKNKKGTKVIVGVVVGVIFYILVARLFKMEELSDLLSLVKRKK